MAKVHLEDQDAPAGPATRSICGLFDVRLTRDVPDVTCKLCERELAREAARLVTVPRFVPGEEAPARFGTRELTSLSKAALERAVHVQVERSYRWKSPQQAIRALAIFRQDGAALGSTSNPSRFDKAPRGRTDPMGQLAGQVDHLVGVSTALDRAYPEPRRLTWTVCGECSAPAPCEGHTGRVEGVDLTPKDQTGILLLAQLRAPDNVAARAEHALEERHGQGRARITAHHVKMIVRAGLDAVADHLREIGEMPSVARRGRRESEAMAVRGYDLSGWDEIEEHTGISVGALRPLSKREVDPLPVYAVPGARAYQARRAEIDAWLERHSTPVSSS